jgi:hypothetical protein
VRASKDCDRPNSAKQQAIASVFHHRFLKGEEGVTSPFGCWTGDIHPWLQKALRYANQFEKKKFVFPESSFEDGPLGDWADLVESDWSLKGAVDRYGPALWQFASENRFSGVTVKDWESDDFQTVPNCKERKDGTKKGINKNKKLNLKIKTISHSWRKSWKDSVSAVHKGLTPLYPVEEFFQPRIIETEYDYPSLHVLAACAAGPRDLLSSIPVPPTMSSTSSLVSRLLDLSDILDD